MLAALMLAQIAATSTPLAEEARAPVAAVTEEARLPAGEPIELMVMTEVTGDRAIAGAPVKLMLNKPVMRDGRTLIPAGAPAFGEVVSVGKSGPALKAGSLRVHLVRLVVDGQNLAIDGDVREKGRGGTSDDAVKVVFVPLYALFSPGNAGKLKAGDLIQAALTHAYAYRADEPGVPKLHEIAEPAQPQLVVP